MVVRIERKRRRGERTYHGHHTKRKGAGNRGGRGNVSRHKHFIKFRERKENKGFSYPLRREYKIINLDRLNDLIKKMLDEGNLDRNNIEIDLNKFGVDKLLGRGKLKYKILVKVNKASQKAIEKIRNLGGEVVLKD
ncbi:MAG: uL15m family ribosomal protein [Candidatus Aenigmatarchaeota archaeon]